METNQATELAVIINDSGLETGKVDNLLSQFAENFKAAKHIVEESKGIVVTSEDQKHEMENARHARIELKNIRVEVEKTRKQLKEQSLREGRAIDGIANVIKAVIIPAEEHLEKQEKFAERLAAERLATRNAERQATLLSFVSDTSVYAFQSMDDASFNQLVQSLDDAKKAKEEAERQAQAERDAAQKAAAEEAERMRQENAKLRAEAEAREAELTKQRQIEQARQAKERAEQEKLLAAERAKAEEERKKREQIEAEQKAKEQAEAEAKAALEEQQRKQLLAPDKEKLVKFAETIEQIEMPNVANREAGKLLDETEEFLKRISKNLRQKAEKL